VAQALTPSLGQSDFDAALVADDSTMLHALVFAAQAFPISNRAKDAGAEESVALRLKGAVVDGFPAWSLRHADQLRIFSGEASEMRMASKSVMGLVRFQNGLERVTRRRPPWHLASDPTTPKCAGYESRDESARACPPREAIPCEGQAWFLRKPGKTQGLKALKILNRLRPD